MSRDALVAAGLDPGDVAAVIERARSEDLGTSGDLTSAATVPATATMTASYVARDNGVIAGMPVLAAIIDTSLTDGRLENRVTDGDRVRPGDRLAVISGNAREVLAVERLSLNLLGHLSGIATATRRWVDAVEGTGARIRDTRKTIPGLRDLEKYAVRCGGGVNHRRGLDSAVLIKDNHVAAAGGVGAALDQVAAAYPDSGLIVQVEVDTLEQLDEALAHGATQILLDNFSIEDMTLAVKRIRAAAGGVLVEASGRLRLADARRVAGTGVDFLAVGALTHSAPVFDIGLDMEA
ncbi:MAG: carboxylating nicotinate-nucleotide diphosphorylase [Frankiaceae bacterium]|nr:carboxylating nicotinate-nucleotide diphosphorylase [Frankiaceae bacterium]